MEPVQTRLARLERSIRHQRFAIVGLLVVTVGVAVMPLSSAQQSTDQPVDTIRARNLIIEDATGRPRIRLGAPLPGSGTPRTGMRITDTRGFERLGLNLFDDGRMVVGIDGPPPASGPVSNLERINLVADADGTSYIVFKTPDTRVVARMYVDRDGKAWMEFADFAPTPPSRRRYGLKGEETPR